MPFTLTHIAAVLPVAAAAPRVFPFSALVVGSMIPDLPMFVTLPITYATTHSITGIFLACLPLGMACLLTFQWLMKRPLLALLPELIRSRCASLSISQVEPTFKYFSSSALAIVIGATTHVFWDSFTHQGRWGSSLFPRLNDNVLTIWGYDLPAYKALQYGSSLVLLPCIVLLVVYWFSRQRPVPLGGLPALPKLWLVSVRLIGSLIPAFVTIFVWTCDRRTPYVKIGQSITASGLALGIASLTYCVFFHVTFGYAFQRVDPPRPE